MRHYFIELLVVESELFRLHLVDTGRSSALDVTDIKFADTMARGTLSTLQKWETYFSVLNHIMIGSASLYVTWHCYHFGITIYTMHVWLSTIGVSSRNRFSTVYFSQISRLRFSVSVADD